MNGITLPSPLLIIKIMIVSGLVVYTIFTFILTRQVDNNRKTVETSLGGLLEFIALLHFFASLGLLLFSAFIL
ncbi:hypothetical protein HY468_04095 [Candidatus Roizmanbacteria bacterium]|nr:hypothetical protein [Candidatus Roizmanbacteria bacterium]